MPSTTLAKGKLAVLDWQVTHVGLIVLVDIFAIRNRLKRTQCL